MKLYGNEIYWSIYIVVIMYRYNDAGGTYIPMNSIIEAAAMSLLIKNIYGKLEFIQSKQLMFENNFLRRQPTRCNVIDRMLN